MAGYLESSEARARSAPKSQPVIAICGQCGLVQQVNLSNRDVLLERVYSSYQPTYSMSASVVEYASGLLQRASRVAGVRHGDHVVEIGSNDGRFLKMIEQSGAHAVGFEPADNLVSVARESRLDVIQDYFGTKSAREYLNEHPPARLVITRHTLEHAFDIVDFLKGIAIVLDADGIAVIEVPYLRLQMINGHFEAMSFQHESHFVVGTISHALRMAGLTIVSVDFVRMDGGSIVVIAQKADSAGSDAECPEVENFRRMERALEMHNPGGYAAFFDRVKMMCRDVRDYLDGLAASGLTVCAYGAGGKGQNLVNMLGLDIDQIRFAVDDSPGSEGRYIPGTSIAVVPSRSPAVEEADVVLVTAPTHVREIVAKEQARLSNARFLATVPDFHYVPRDEFPR